MLTVYDSDGRKVAETDDPVVAALVAIHAGPGATIRARMRVAGHGRGVVLYRVNGDETMDGCDLERVAAAAAAEARRLTAEARARRAS